MQLSKVVFPTLSLARLLHSLCLPFLAVYPTKGSLFWGDVVLPSGDEKSLEGEIKSALYSQGIEGLFTSVHLYSWVESSRSTLRVIVGLECMSKISAKQEV